MRVFLCCVFFTGVAFAADLKVLDHDAYEIWRNLSDERISNDGKWAAYTLSPQDGDPVVEVRATDGEASYDIEDGDNPRFDAGSRFVIYDIKPKKETVRQAKRDKVKKEKMPIDGMGILTLARGERTAIDNRNGRSGRRACARRIVR